MTYIVTSFRVFEGLIGAAEMPEDERYRKALQSTPAAFRTAFQAFSEEKKKAFRSFAKERNYDVPKYFSYVPEDGKFVALTTHSEPGRPMEPSEES